MKPSESKFRECLYYAANALARKVEKLAISSWKPVGIPPSHGYLLMLVLDEPGTQPGTLAKELQLTPSTITRLIEKLEKEKLVVRTTDGKLTNIYPTPQAKALQPAMKKCIENFSSQYIKILGSQDSSRMVTNMNKLNDKLGG